MVLVRLAVDITIPGSEMLKYFLPECGFLEPPIKAIVKVVEKLLNLKKGVTVMKERTSQEALFSGLVEAFSNAFKEAEKQGINVKDLFWFKSEAEKIRLETQHR